MYTILYTAKDLDESMKVATRCVFEGVSFDFLNGNEFFFVIHDDEDLHRKQTLVGKRIINPENKVL